MGSSAQQARLQRRLKTVVYRKRDDERHYSRGDPKYRDHRDHRDDRLLPLGAQIAKRDDPLEPLHLSNSRRRSAIPISPSGRNSGNRITSRMEPDPVRIIVSRSMPMPSPAAGGMPKHNART